MDKYQELMLRLTIAQTTLLFMIADHTRDGMNSIDGAIAQENMKTMEKGLEALNDECKKYLNTQK
jgi:hypothetical protein